MSVLKFCVSFVWSDELPISSVLPFSDSMYGLGQVA